MGHNILVTGGAGYLGSILIPELLQSGNRVTVLDNFTYKQNSLAHVCNNANFQVVKGDVRLKKTLVPLLNDAEIIIPETMGQARRKEKRLNFSPTASDVRLRNTRVFATPR